MFKAQEIKPGIWWVGALEWDERYIHGFSMPNGSTNNAYLIMDDHITLVDTCTEAYWPQLMERIEDVVDPARIEYVISNHAEKDHAGSLRQVLARTPQAKVVTTKQGQSILKTYLGEDPSWVVVKTGDELPIGTRTLTFVQTPMVHWPDNMVTYSPADKLLLSNDAFGQFLCTSERFDDEVDACLLFASAKKYFANIIMPFAKQTKKALDAVCALDVDMIAPSHGLIWRSNIPGILDAYARWTALEPTDSAVVAFASMYGSTRRMAEAITEAFMAAGISVRMYDLHESDISDIMTDVMDAEYVAVGSPTHNMTTLPEVGAFLTYLKGLAPKGRRGIAFGSYGWADAAQTEIASVMERAGYQMMTDPLVTAWNDAPADAQAIFDGVTRLLSD